MIKLDSFQTVGHRYLYITKRVAGFDSEQVAAQVFYLYPPITAIVYMERLGLTLTLTLWECCSEKDCNLQVVQGL